MRKTQRDRPSWERSSRCLGRDFEASKDSRKSTVFHQDCDAEQPTGATKADAPVKQRATASRAIFLPLFQLEPKLDFVRGFAIFLLLRRWDLCSEP